MKLRLTIPEFCETTGTSRSAAYERIRRGELVIVRDGKRAFVTAEEAKRYASADLPPIFTRARSDKVSAA